MPPCARCDMLKANQCSALTRAKETLGRPLPPPPLGACMIPIVESYLSMIEEGTRILDVGCGSWNLIRSHCEKIGAHYEGIDVQPDYFGEKVIATRIENLQELSFPDDHFDVVIGNQILPT